MTLATQTERIDGAWSVKLLADTTLLARHECGAEVRGPLSFHTGDDVWSVVPSRDSVPARPALLDTQGNVQGYLAISGSGDRLKIRVVHRTAQFYGGALRLEATVTLGESSFACRTTTPAQGDVVQMGTGAADSGLNDSVFDVETDTALRFEGASIQLATMDGTFALQASANIHDASCAAIILCVERDYYRSQYAPSYTPIDRARCPSPPTGWMSWNVYFDQAGAEENLAEARMGAEHLKPFGLEFWSIESWQANSDTLPVRNFHNLNMSCHPGQFPEGMKHLADDIRALGFRPGIWTAPFGTGSEEFYEEHREWFLHDSQAKPMMNWCGQYLLDPSQPEVRDHMREMHRRMAREWGYEFFKIDGMSGRGPGYSAHFFERDDVRSVFRNECDNPFELCVEAFREGIGDDCVFLACQGHYSGPEARQADAARIGGDIVSPNKPSGWHNILSQSRATLNQLFVNNIILYGDPDTLLVGDYHSLEEARVTATVVALPGQLMFAGDKLGQLPAERMRLLQQALPVCDVRPLDLFPIFQRHRVWDLKVQRTFGQWDVVALFNWTDEDGPVEFQFSDLGLPADGAYVLHEFWTQTFHGVHEGGFSLDIPAHGTRLLVVSPLQDRPQFIGCDRHITQGAVSIRDLQWDEQNKALHLEIDVVGGYAFRYRFHVPTPHCFVKATAEGADIAGQMVGENVLEVSIAAADSGRVACNLIFDCSV